MNTFHTRRLEVKAVRFEQHRKPWPVVVEPVHTNGIPEPRLEGGNIPVRNGDYIISVGSTLFMLPPSVFSRLFEPGPGATEDPRLAKALEEILALERQLNELLEQRRPEPCVPPGPDVFDALPATGETGSPNEGGLP